MTSADIGRGPYWYPETSIIRSRPHIGMLDRLEGLAARLLGRLPPHAQVRLSGRPPIAIDGQVLDPQLQLALAIRHRRGVMGLVHRGIARSRLQFRRDMVVHRGPRTEVGRVHDAWVPTPSAHVPIRHYVPAGAAADGAPLLVFLHGGGYVMGDLDTHDEACRLLCRHGTMHVLAVGYRLAPEHPFPAALDDARDAWRWTHARAAALGADPARLAIGGDSAGATLATVVAMHERAGRRHRPAAQLLLYPPADSASNPHPSHAMFGEGLFLTRADREAFTHAYLDGTGVPRTDARIAPLRADDLADLPPALVVTGGFDLLRDEGEAYAAALQAAGVPVTLRRHAALPHGFINMTGVSRAARDATVDTARALRALLDATPT